jgi:predicted NUDIX family NTP pyrophosphohydrolase
MRNYPICNRTVAIARSVIRFGHAAS